MSSPLDIAASAMHAQMLRLNTVASNLANADTVSSTEEGAYRSRQPVFSAVLQEQQGMASVQVSEIMESQAPIQKHFQPGHPQADENGFVYSSNVNTVEEMANMMAASSG